jgi:hypothetical protein
LALLADAATRFAGAATLVAEQGCPGREKFCVRSLEFNNLL